MKTVIGILKFLAWFTLAAIAVVLFAFLGIVLILAAT